MKHWAATAFAILLLAVTGLKADTVGSPVAQPTPLEVMQGNHKLQDWFGTYRAICTTGTVTLAGGSKFHDIIYAKGFVYATSVGGSAHLVKINADNMQTYQTLSIPDAGQYMASMTYDQKRAKIYTVDSTGGIWKVDPVSFSTATKISTGTAQQNFHCITNDGNFIYVGWIGTPAIIQQYDATTYALVKSTDLHDNTGSALSDAHAIDFDGKDIYVTGEYSAIHQPWIARVSTTNLSFQYAYMAAVNDSPCDKFALSGNSVYVGNESSSVVYVYDKTTLIRSTITTPGCSSYEMFAMTDGLIYDSCDAPINGQNTMVVIDPKTNSFFTADIPGNDVSNGITTDGSRLFYTTWHDPAQIVRILPPTPGADSTLHFSGFGGTDMLSFNFANGAVTINGFSGGGAVNPSTGPWSFPFPVTFGNILAAPTNPSPSITYGAGANGDYFSNGNSFGFEVVAYKIINGTQFFSASSGQTSTDDDNTNTNMYVDFNWDAVPGADGYRVFILDPYYLGANYDYYYETTNNFASIGKTGASPDENGTTQGTTRTPLVQQTIIDNSGISTGFLSSGKVYVNRTTDDGTGAPFQVTGLTSLTSTAGLEIWDDAHTLNYITLDLASGVTADFGVRGKHSIGGSYPMQFYLYDNDLGNGDFRVVGFQPRYDGTVGGHANYVIGITKYNNDGGLHVPFAIGYDGTIYMGPTDYGFANGARLLVDGPLHTTGWGLFDSSVTMSNANNSIAGYLSLSSASVSYVGISSLTASHNVLTLSSAAVSYLGISSTPANTLSISSAAVSYTAISTNSLNLTKSSAAVSYVGISSLTAANNVLTLSSAAVSYLGISSGVTAGMLSISSAAVSYLGISSVPVGSLSISSASATYMSISSATTIYITSTTSAGGDTVPLTNVWFDILSTMTLTTGDWEINAVGIVFRNSATFTSTTLELCIGNAAGTSTTGCTPGRNHIFIQDVDPTTFTYQPINIPPMQFTVSGSENHYLKARINAFSVGNPKILATMSARQIHH